MKYIIHKSEHICKICNKPSISFVVVNNEKMCSNCYSIQQELSNPEIQKQKQELEKNHIKNQEIYKKSNGKNKKKYKKSKYCSKKIYAVNGITSICRG